MAFKSFSCKDIASGASSSAKYGINPCLLIDKRRELISKSQRLCEIKICKLIKPLSNYLKSIQIIC